MNGPNTSTNSLRVAIVGGGLARIPTSTITQNGCSGNITLVDTKNYDDETSVLNSEQCIIGEVIEASSKDLNVAVGDTSDARELKTVPYDVLCICTGTPSNVRDLIRAPECDDPADVVLIIASETAEVRSSDFAMEWAHALTSLYGAMKRKEVEAAKLPGLEKLLDTSFTQWAINADGTVVTKTATATTTQDPSTPVEHPPSLENDLQLLKHIDSNTVKAQMGLLRLPDEILLHVFSYLTAQDLAMYAAVSSEWYRLCNDQALWKRLFVQLWPHTDRADRVYDAGPSPRLCHTAVIYGKYMFIYGGMAATIDPTTKMQTIGAVKDDIYRYCFDDGKWKKMKGSFLKNTEHTSVLYNGCMYSFGGFTDRDYHNHLLVYNIKKKSFKMLKVKGTPPSVRSAHSAVMYNHAMWIFGGWNGASRVFFNDLHCFDFKRNRWEAAKTSGTPPLPRCSHATVVHANSMYVFGGFAVEYKNDISKYDFVTGEWTPVKAKGSIPSGRSRTRAVSYKNSMFIFGGWSRITEYNDLYEFDFVNETWSEIRTNMSVPAIALAVPPPDSSCLAAKRPGLAQYSAAVRGNILYLFGGFCGETNSATDTLYAYRLGKKDAVSTEQQEDDPSPPSSSSSSSLLSASCDGFEITRSFTAENSTTSGPCSIEAAGTAAQPPIEVPTKAPKSKKKWWQKVLSLSSSSNSTPTAAPPTTTTNTLPPTTITATTTTTTTMSDDAK